MYCDLLLLPVGEKGNAKAARLLLSLSLSRSRSNEETARLRGWSWEEEDGCKEETGCDGTDNDTGETNLEDWNGV